MMKNITLSKEKVHFGNLLLVNAKSPMQVMNENDLMPITAEAPNVLLKREVGNILKMIFEKEGYSDKIIPVSGYRSAGEQRDIYKTSLRDNGENFTRKFVALPNHSEHQTGLAIDLALKKEDIDFICPEFPYDGVCDEFRKAAPLYGFIERYPDGKEQITGIAHEPWHFRYVGYPHSEIMTENKLTLEEYIEFIKQFLWENNHLRIHRNEKNIEVFYAAAGVTGMTTITLPEKTVYQVSGNNVDGFIVTLWENRK